MATINNDLTCGVCKQVYKNPVVHRLCGLSFDRECIGRKCPAQECHRDINENDLITNYTLMKIADEHRLSLELPPIYYIILLDTSTSMWYSDSWLPFALGESRFTYAIQVLTAFFKLKMHSTTDQISLFTFGTVPLQQFDFTVIKKNHLEILEDLKCEDKDTALFDSIDFCVDKLKQINTILNNQKAKFCLLILTDGSNNFGKKESEHAINIARRSAELQISGHMIQIGDTNRRKTRRICDFLGYTYNHFKGGNAMQVANSLVNSIETKTRARASRAQSAINSTASMLNQLPNVPDTPVNAQALQRERVLA